MRIGVFGGSFDPVHTGHLLVAECCREQAALDRVLFVPAAIPPHKQNRLLATAEHRLNMLSLACGGNPYFAISTDEMDRGGISYTVDTLCRLRLKQPTDELFLVLGPDALAQLPGWHEAAKIIELAELIAVERHALDDVQAVVRAPELKALLGPQRLAQVIASRVRMPAIAIRASDLRTAVADGQSIRYRTPRAVEQYIATHGVYRSAAQENGLPD